MLLVLLLYILAIGLFMIPSCSTGRYKSRPQRESYMNFITAGVKDVSSLTDDISTEIQIPEIDRTDAYAVVEAETVARPLYSEIKTVRSGFSGYGYVSELPEHTQSALVFSINVPNSQHYALTACLGSDYGGNGAIRINQAMVKPFSLSGGKSFTRVTFYCIFLEKGINEIALDIDYGHLECDYIEIVNDCSLDEIDFDIQDSPCDPHASPSARKLYGFLHENWGTGILTGQYVSDNSNRELGIIYQLTGQLPVIRFSELGTNDDTAQIEAAIDWSVYMNGIVGLMWQWRAPNTTTVYASESDFDLQEALQGVDVNKLAEMPEDEICESVRQNKLPEACHCLIEDIDKTALCLRKLADMDIPVLWRPLHEAGGEWYWWGASGAQPYEELWELLFRRLTDYHHLHNLIWVWNAQSADFSVPADTYDIASADVYIQPDRAFGSRSEQYVSLARITDGRKMLALSECSALPDQKMMLIDQSVWSFFGLWYGEYIMHSDGSFSDRYYSSSDLYKLYNSDLTFSLNDFLSLYQ